MKLKLNSREITDISENAATVGEVLHGIVNKRFRKKEFITGIILDGKTVPEKEYDGIVEKQTSEVESLDITTDHPKDISLRTLEKMDEFLDSLSVLIGQSADKFRLDDEGDANKHFIGCVEALQTFIKVVENVRALNSLDYGAIALDGVPVTDRLTGFLTVFNNLHETQRQKDWVNLADVLEYELSPLVQEWKEIVPLITAKVTEAE